MNKWVRYSQGIVAGIGIAALLTACDQVIPKAETATVATAVKTPASKTVTNFTASLRCMDDMLQAYGKRDFVITTAGIPDSTGKVMAGTKEMLITAASKMSIKSKALTFIDYDTTSNDLLQVFQDIAAAGVANNRKLPKYYIRGAITTLDENAIDAQAGGGIALPFLDLGMSKDQFSSVVSIDMNVGDTVSREIISGVNASNSLVITRAGNSKDVGGKIGKVGFSFNMALNKAEGLGGGVRALIELGMIEMVGKLTGTPYWKCLQIDKTNPTMIQQARDWYDGMTRPDLVKLVQRKLNGMGKYSGAIDGREGQQLAAAIGSYQAENGLIADGRINFDLYYNLLDADQPIAGDPAPSAPVATAAKSQAGAGAGGPMTVKLSSDRGPKPVYHPQDFLQARVELGRDGVLYCYYKDAGGTIARIYPNRFNPNPFVQANKTMSLPPEGSPFKIRFDKAKIKEQVVCYASDRDLALPANLKAADLTPISVGSMAEIGNAFRKSNPGVAEAVLDISVQ